MYKILENPVKHSCEESPDWEGILMPEICEGCVEAMKHPCVYCGYGNAFVSHNPDPHYNGLDPILPQLEKDITDEWYDSPHIYDM